MVHIFISDIYQMFVMGLLCECAWCLTDLEVVRLLQWQGSASLSYHLCQSLLRECLNVCVRCSVRPFVVGWKGAERLCFMALDVKKNRQTLQMWTKTCWGLLVFQNDWNRNNSKNLRLSKGLGNHCEFTVMELQTRAMCAMVWGQGSFDIVDKRCKSCVDLQIQTWPPHIL